jgi:hypothetical protein
MPMQQSSLSLSARSKRPRYSERMRSSQEVIPAIKMVIGDWYVDELGMPTREITARE